ncbi:hypothetical protein [Subtercola lobariae]|uniref:hypothetical protein n=1 Tax=Subtercola lobariae TaxID=1588641 RepID=UPI001665246D|nr:hypothetical protein [Subtercola lobariae]
MELRPRTPVAWKRSILNPAGVVFEFCRHSPDMSDLIVISLDDLRVAHLIAAGDDDESERMLASARRALLTSSPEDFAREWRIPLS